MVWGEDRNGGDDDDDEYHNINIEGRRKGRRKAEEETGRWKDKSEMRVLAEEQGGSGPMRCCGETVIGEGWSDLQGPHARYQGANSNRVAAASAGAGLVFGSRHAFYYLLPGCLFTVRAQTVSCL